MREQARTYFNETLKLCYSDITLTDIQTLHLFLKETLRNTELAIPTLRMSQRIDFQPTSNQTLKYCGLYVNSRYFKQREAITFNSDGFIGFCGWASSENVQPFVEAFNRWCEGLAEDVVKRKERRGDV